MYWLLAYSHYPLIQSFVRTINQNKKFFPLNYGISSRDFAIISIFLNKRVWRSIQTLYHMQNLCTNFKLFPHSLKFLDKLFCSGRVLGDKKILLVPRDGLSGPVEGTVDQNSAVFDGKLVVHQKTWLVCPHCNSYRGGK